ncbi:MAG: thioredoxin family protein [Haloferacaceae archaeon]
MTPTLSSREDQYRFLVETDVFVETDGRVATTEEFEATRAVYRATYADVDDETFHGTVASLFDLSEAAAEARIDDLGVTRAELIAYLALDSHLDEAAPDVEVGTDALASMAGMVADVAPVSPVPAGMRELTDDDYRAFLRANPDAVVFVWKLHCDPCDAMKAELDRIREAIPGGVAVAGVDGESVEDFRRDYGVDAAPTTLAFADGDLVDALEGRRRPDRLADLFAEAFGDD